jgi:hypothetical protein
MPAERCRVVVHIHGQNQYYQRDREEKGRDGKWFAQPFFVINPREAITMSEAQAIVFVHKLRSLGVDPWVEDAATGRRIDVPHETQSSSGEDTRQPVIATLNDIDWYIVRPANTPNGRQWFICMFVPGFPERLTIYSNEPLAVLQRAQDLNYLQFVEKYQRPEPQQATPTINKGPRLRPGGALR